MRSSSLDKSCRRTNSNNNNKCNFNNNKLRPNNSASTKCTVCPSSRITSLRTTRWVLSSSRTHHSRLRTNGNNSNNLWISANRYKCPISPRLPRPSKTWLLLPRRACSYLHLLLKFPRLSRQLTTKPLRNQRPPKLSLKNKNWRTWKSSWRSSRARSSISPKLSKRTHRLLVKSSNRRSSKLLNKLNNSRIYKRFSSCKLPHRSNSSHLLQANMSKWTSNRVKHRNLRSQLAWIKTNSASSLNIPNSSNHNSMEAKWCISEILYILCEPI